MTAAASSAPTVGIGTSGQTLGDLTITEALPGALDANATYSALEDNASSLQVLATDTTTSAQADLDIVAPVGVTFDTTPTVTVTSGNLQLGAVTTGTGLTVDSSVTAGNQGVLVIPIQSSSTTASTIKIAAPEVTIDNTVPEGPITFKVEGPAVDETTFSGYTSGNNITYSQLFPNDTAAVAVNVATVGTASGTVTQSVYGTAVFMIGQTSYTLNGQSETMDVAPYIKDSRTFLPIRYVAEALGVPDSSISFNNGQVVINNNGAMVVLNIGSTTMLVGGAPVTMDTAPEITSGRTCLPVAWVAQALGAKITWDAATQAVTVTF